MQNQIEIGDILNELSEYHIKIKHYSFDNKSFYSGLCIFDIVEPEYVGEMCAYPIDSIKCVYKNDLLGILYGRK